MAVCLVVLCGLPGCGKTTFCKQFCSYACSRTTWSDVPALAVVHIEFDLIERQLKGDTQEFNPIIWKKKSNNSNVFILVDDNMYLKSMRHDIVKIAETLHVSFVQLYFDVSLAVSKQRNALRQQQQQQQQGRAVPLHVIDFMGNALEKPKTCDFTQTIHLSWNKRTLVITEEQQRLLSNLETWESIIVKPLLRLAAIPMNVQRPKAAEKQPFDHIIDIKLRSVVGNLIKEAREESVDSARIAKYAHDLAERKKAVLARVKAELMNEELDDDQKLSYGVSMFLGDIPLL